MPAAERDRLHVSIDEQLRAAPLRAAQETLVQAVHVDVAGGLVEQGQCDGCFAQHRHQGACCGCIEQARPRALVAQLFVQRMQGIDAIGGGHVERTTRREQRWLAVERRFEKGTAGPCQRAHLGRSIALHEHRRRAPGAVQAGLGFAFEQRHPHLRRQEVGHRGPGNAGTNHKHIEL